MLFSSVPGGCNDSPVIGANGIGFTRPRAPPNAIFVGGSPSGMRTSLKQSLVMCEPNPTQANPKGFGRPYELYPGRPAHV